MTLSRGSAPRADGGVAGVHLTIVQKRGFCRGTKESWSEAQGLFIACFFYSRSRPKMHAILVMRGLLPVTDRIARYTRPC
mmetsp:Transcript_44383/g.117761  ORF Transcript_44383/g.117761 Transcript_44383/m.117761 type:complete len:80 (+) Transcript_44383:617-856(+)